jgi:hypothetical protein
MNPIEFQGISERYVRISTDFWGSCCLYGIRSSFPLILFFHYSFEMSHDPEDLTPVISSGKIQDSEVKDCDIEYVIFLVDDRMKDFRAEYEERLAAIEGKHNNKVPCRGSKGMLKIFKCKTMKININHHLTLSLLVFF